MRHEAKSRLKRVLKIIRMLHAGPVRSNEIAAKFGVTRRTICRDIDLIRQSWGPVAYCPETRAYVVNQ